MTGDVVHVGRVPVKSKIIHPSAHFTLYVQHMYLFKTA
jgi:hypothetical protein